MAINSSGPFSARPAATGGGGGGGVTPAQLASAIAAIPADKVAVSVKSELFFTRTLTVPVTASATVLDALDSTSAAVYDAANMILVAPSFVAGSNVWYRSPEDVPANTGTNGVLHAGHVSTTVLNDGSVIFRQGPPARYPETTRIHEYYATFAAGVTPAAPVITYGRHAGTDN